MPDTVLIPNNSQQQIPLGDFTNQLTLLKEINVIIQSIFAISLKNTVCHLFKSYQWPREKQGTFQSTGISKCILTDATMVTDSTLLQNRILVLEK